MSKIQPNSRTLVISVAVEIVILSKLFRKNEKKEKKRKKHNLPPPKKKPKKLTPYLFNRLTI